MRFKFHVDFGYWAIPLGLGIQSGWFWVSILCFNLDVAWKTGIDL